METISESDRLRIDESFQLQFSIRGWLEYFGQRPLVYGGIDIFGLGSSFNIDFISSLIATVDGFMTNKGRHAFKKALILLPQTFEDIDSDRLLKRIEEKIHEDEPELESDEASFLQISEAISLNLLHFVELRRCAT